MEETETNYNKNKKPWSSINGTSKRPMMMIIQNLFKEKEAKDKQINDFGMDIKKIQFAINKLEKERNESPGYYLKDASKISVD